MRDILYPREINNKFEADSKKFVFGMGMIAILGFLGCLRQMKLLEYVRMAIFNQFLNCLVVAVPPGLPCAASCGLIFALARL